MDDELTVTETADLLRYTTRRVRQLIAAGRFPGAHKIGDNGPKAQWRIPRQDIDTYRNPPTGAQQ